jgi:hypothetical protein
MSLYSSRLHWTTLTSSLKRTSNRTPPGRSPSGSRRSLLGNLSEEQGWAVAPHRPPATTGHVIDDLGGCHDGLHQRIPPCQREVDHSNRRRQVFKIRPFHHAGTSIMSDRDPMFTSQFWSELFALSDISYTCHPPSILRVTANQKLQTRSSRCTCGA